MCTDSSRAKRSVEIADIFNQHYDSYRQEYGVSAQQQKATNAICNCRTAALGGNVCRCPLCDKKVMHYNSCRNRHCPKCQSMAKAKWLAKRQAELLPVEYFHLVFTIPHELNCLAGYNPALIYNILFDAAWHTIKTLGLDEKRLGGNMGMLAALHTWGQNLSQHIHLHCIVPGGALKADKWISCKPGFLFPVQVISKLFRGKFVSLLREAYQGNQFKLEGSAANLGLPGIFADLLKQLMCKDWCVYAKKPFDGAKGAVDYLAKYVYKTAISNNRILSCDEDKVAFNYRDYADNNKIKTMELEPHEFIRRFLSHVLPKGFMRVRCFGFLANSCKRKKIRQICDLLNHQPEEVATDIVETAAEIMLRLTGIDITICPHCKIGKLEIIETIPNFKQRQSHKFLDTS